jgi:hypothetical protein
MRETDSSALCREQGAIWDSDTYQVTSCEDMQTTNHEHSDMTTEILTTKIVTLEDHLLTGILWNGSTELCVCITIP